MQNENRFEDEILVGGRFLKSLALACVLLSILPTTPAFAANIPIEVSEAPDSDLSLTLEAISSAQSSILLNIYDLTSPEITDALIERIHAGVQVEILEEGQPVGGLSAAARGIQSSIMQAMSGHSGDRLLEMTSRAGGRRRYRYDHAKYIVVDAQSVLVGSENYSPTGNPTPGSLGNRGWEVFIHDAAVAQDFTNLFRIDTDTLHQDVLNLLNGNAPALELAPALPRKSKPPHPGAPGNPVPPAAPAPATLGKSLPANSVTRVSSPDDSIGAVVALLNSAMSQIDVETMTFDPAFGAAQSPLVTALLSAARRGVHVRVLLNDSSVFAHSGQSTNPKNTQTEQLLNSTAARENLQLEARTANLKGMGVDYIHNKGALIDGSKTLISSINWDQNSFENNRETAVIIDSTEINAYFQSYFDRDWSVSSAGAAGVFSTALAPALNAAPVAIENVACPSSLHLSAQIGELTLTDGSDRAYETISGKKIESDFIRSNTADGCVLEDSEDSSPQIERKTGEKLFVQIRSSRSAGVSSTTLALEGFTPNGKAYSVRARFSGSVQNRSYAASVFDGSDASRERLGDASLAVSGIR